MATVRYFWHGLIHSGTFMYLQYRRPLIIFCQMFGRRRIPSARPCLLMFRIVRPVTQFISCILPGSSQWFFHFGEEIVIVQHSGKDDNTWWYSTPSFCITMPEVRPLLLSRTSCAAGSGRFWNIHRTHPIWVHTITNSSPKWKNHCEGPATTQAMNRVVSTEHQQRQRDFSVTPCEIRSLGQVFSGCSCLSC